MSILNSRDTGSRIINKNFGKKYFLSRHLFRKILHNRRKKLTYVKVFCESIEREDIILKEVPIWEKLNLTIEEASVYSGIGINKIREMMKERDCNFVLKVGIKKTLIKRKKFEQYLSMHEII